VFSADRGCAEQDERAVTLMASSLKIPHSRGTPWCEGQQVVRATDQAARGDVGEQALRCIRFGKTCHCSQS